MARRSLTRMRRPLSARSTTALSGVEVTSVSPAVAPTDTVVDVVVNGSGFARGAAAKWSINGDTTKVHVLSTMYVSPSQLRATVQLPAGAPTGSYDVEVYLRDGKKGVGVEMFLVVPGDPSTDVFFPLDDSQAPRTAQRPSVQRRRRRVGVRRWPVRRPQQDLLLNGAVGKRRRDNPDGQSGRKGPEVRGIPAQVPPRVQWHHRHATGRISRLFAWSTSCPRSPSGLPRCAA